MNIGEAVSSLKLGMKVARAGWNGKGMWLALIAETPTALVLSTGFVVPYRNILPWVGMKTADGKFVPWLCSQTDLLAEDWEIVP